MKAIEISQGIFWAGVKDWNLQDFHGHLTPMHSTYNSYLIVDEKPTLIDGAKLTLSEEMIARVKSIIDFQKLAYIVINHVEMDHSGNLPELMKLAPQMKIITDQAGKMALEAHYDTSGWEYVLVKTGDELSIGKRTLQFVQIPMLHWPESMVTYLKEDKILFSSDAFGQHVCTNTIFVKDLPMEVVLREAKRYYANILMPYCTQAGKAVDSVDLLELDIIAPGHGCVWVGKEEIQTILATYKKWASGENNGSAVVVYDTMWGSVAKLADAVKSAFEDLDIPVIKMCLRHTHYSEVVMEMMDAKYVAIGSPTLNNLIYPSVAAYLTYIKGLAFKNKTGFAFNSYGWKPGVVEMIQDYIRQMGWTESEPFAVKFVPKGAGLEEIVNHVKNKVVSQS